MVSGAGGRGRGRGVKWDLSGMQGNVNIERGEAGKSSVGFSGA